MDKLFHDLIINWFPIILLIAIWIFIMRRYGGKVYKNREDSAKLNQEISQHLEKIVKQLDELIEILYKKK